MPRWWIFIESEKIESCARPEAIIRRYKDLEQVLHLKMSTETRCLWLTTDPLIAENGICTCKSYASPLQLKYFDTTKVVIAAH